MAVYISEIAYATGDIEEIENLISQGVPEQNIKLFKKFGLRTYAKSSGNIYSLAFETANKSISYSKDAIKELIFTTGSFHTQPMPFNRIQGIRDLNYFINCLGIDVFPYGVYLSDCSNFITALKIGKGLLTDESDKEILMVTSDIVGESESRIVPPGSTIKSDGAGSCILSINPKGRCFQVLEIKQYHNPVMVGVNDLTHENYAAEFTKCLDFVKDKFLTNKANNYKYILANNYSNSYIRSLSVQLGIPQDLFYRDQIQKYAHCFSSDLLINMSNLIRDNKLKDGDLLLGIASGPSSISGISLRYVEQ